MENTSLPNDVWNNATESASDADDLTLYLANIRDLALKVIYIIIGTVGVLDNLFVLIVFILFIKITDKVLYTTCRPVVFKLFWLVPPLPSPATSRGPMSFDKKRIRSPSGVWGGAPAANAFRTFYAQFCAILLCP